MKMDEMNKKFENEGFDVKRIYDKITKAYTFTISKDGRTYSELFEYPEHVGPVSRDAMQRDFIKHMITQFKLVHAVRDDSVDALAYAYSYMTPIAEGCTCTATKNGLEISGHLTNEGKKLYCVGGRQNGKTFAIHEFLDKEFHIPPFEGPASRKVPKIKDVIFNDPATIVFWSDGTKTVVKCQNDEKFDPEKGLAMAISKKALGNKGNYYNTFDKCLKKYNPAIAAIAAISNMTAEGFIKLATDIACALGGEHAD